MNVHVLLANLKNNYWRCLVLHYFFLPTPCVCFNECSLNRISSKLSIVSQLSIVSLLLIVSPLSIVSLLLIVSRIFGLEKNASDVIYVNWLSLCLSGVGSLESYSPTSNEWKQAHSQARFALLQVKWSEVDFFANSVWYAPFGYFFQWHSIWCIAGLELMPSWLWFCCLNHETI